MLVLPTHEHNMIFLYWHLLKYVSITFDNCPRETCPEDKGGIYFIFLFPHVLNRPLVTTSKVFAKFTVGLKPLTTEQRVPVTCRESCCQQVGWGRAGQRGEHVMGVLLKVPETIS